jgi:hypothetical protein
VCFDARGTEDKFAWVQAISQAALGPANPPVWTRRLSDGSF